MSSPIEVMSALPIVVDEREVERLLGYVPGRRQATPPVRARVAEMIGEARLLIEPRGCYSIRKLPEVPAGGPFRGAERIAYCVCTIGRRLESRVTELARRGEPLRALILDAVGSAAVEAATDLVNAAICARIGQSGQFTSRRISPGYCGWPLAAQQEILTLLPSQVSGVTLTQACYMEPRKSISAAVSVGPNVPHSKYVAMCGYCGLRDCAFRREGAGPPSPPPLR